MADRARKNRALIAGEAADWLVLLREAPASQQTRQSFMAWLLESPVHVHEYLAIAQLWSDLSHIDANAEIDVHELLPASDNIVALGTSTAPDANKSSSRAQRRRVVFYSIAASLLAAVLLGAMYWFAPGDEVTRYLTGLGEQRSIILADGSMVELNTLTEITVSYEADSRRVNLLEGEALFDVQNDPKRPFIVDSGSVLVRVTGTKFNVYRNDQETSVTVLEGAVTVTHRDGAQGSRLLPSAKQASVGAAVAGETANLSAGEQAIVSAGSAEIDTHTLANLEPVTAWTERRLVFDTVTLSGIVAEFNRYNPQRLEIDDPELAELPLSGVFKSNDPDSLIQFLAHIDEIRIIMRPDGSRVIARAEATTP